MNPSDKVVDLPGLETPRLQSNGSGNGNGHLTRHRLAELERRMGILEGRADELIVTCTRIEEQLKGLRESQNNLASKTYVLWTFGITATSLVVTLVGHIFIRSMIGT